MPTGYVRQSAAGIVDGDTISAALFNNEYNQLQSAFDVTVGHDHDGTVGGGQKIPLASAVTGTLPPANGGLGAALTPSNGGILYSTASATAILSGTATVSQVLLSGASTTPSWSTATYPTTTTANQLLYSSSTNVIAGLATGNSGVLITSSGGAPSISSTLPSAVQGNITAVGTIASGTWNGSLIGSTYGGTGVNNGSSTITIGANHILSGAFASTFTFTGITSVTFPTSGTLLTTSVTTLSSLQTATSLTSIGTINSGVWNATVIAGQYGGTGVANTGKTFTLGGNVTYSGANTVTWTTTGTTTLTLPTTGTVATTAVTALTSLTSIGTIATGVWNGTTITVANGGTGATTLASNNVLLGNGTSALQVVAPGTSGNVLTSNGTTWVSSSNTSALSPITNSLSGDVLLNSTSTYFDGPSIAQGSVGTWFAMGTVTLVDPSSPNSYYLAELWDGTTVIASTASYGFTGANEPVSISLSGIITTPAGNIRISIKPLNSTTGKIVYNVTGKSLDSTITAIKVG